MIWKCIYTLYFIISVVLSMYFYTFSRKKQRSREEFECNMIMAHYLSKGFIIISIAIGFVGFLTE